MGRLAHVPSHLFQVPAAGKISHAHGRPPQLGHELGKVTERAGRPLAAHFTKTGQQFR